MMILAISLFKCNCYKDCAFGTYDIPHSLIFVVKKDNNRLEDSILDNMKLFYYKNGMKLYISDFSRSKNEGQYYFRDLGLQGSLDIGFKSSEDNIKDYFLEYPNGDIDTLFVDYKSLSQKEACEHPCRCCCPLERMKFNSKVVSIDSSIKVQTVYIFNKS